MAPNNERQCISDMSACKQHADPERVRSLLYQSDDMPVTAWCVTHGKECPVVHSDTHTAGNTCTDHSSFGKRDGWATHEDLLHLGSSDAASAAQGHHRGDCDTIRFATLRAKAWRHICSCMTNFHSRQRALQHLLCGKRRCLTAIRENMPPVSEERIAEILEEDRVERRRARNNPGSRTESDLPALRHAGPLRSLGITVSRWARCTGQLRRMDVLFDRSSPRCQCLNPRLVLYNGDSGRER